MLFSINTHLPPEVVDHFHPPTELKQANTWNPAQKSHRSSYIAWVPSSNWLCALIETYMRNMNTYYYKYDLTNISEGTCQFTLYNEGDYFDWHIDSDIYTAYSPESPPTYPSPIKHNDYHKHQQHFLRKLSFTLQLSHPEEYTGGELQFNMGDMLETIPKQYGLLTVFDSRISHRVRKVKSGQRKSFVGWMIGPRWR